MYFISSNIFLLHTWGKLSVQRYLWKITWFLSWKFPLKRNFCYCEKCIKVLRHDRSPIARYRVGSIFSKLSGIDSYSIQVCDFPFSKTRIPEWLYHVVSLVNKFLWFRFRVSQQNSTPIAEI